MLRRFASEALTFEVGGVVEAPAVPPRIQGRPHLVGGESPLAPLHLAPPRAGFPLLVRPTGRVDAGDLGALARATRALLDAHLEDTHAVLVRGLPIPSAHEYSRFIRTLGYPRTRYEHSIASRTEIAPRVLTPNAAPPDRCIMLHNEMAFERPVPRHIFFFCEAAPGPGEGGETPIALNRDIHREIGDEVIAHLERRGLRRRIHYPSREDATARPERTWQSQFATTRREDVEARCRLRELAYHWDADGGLTTLIEQPVTIPHAGGRLWFCSPQVARPVTSIEITYRDGSEIEPEIMERLRAVPWRAAVAFSWQPGDLLCLHNLSCQHARLSYAPGATRRLYVSVATAALESSSPHEIAARSA